MIGRRFQDIWKEQCEAARGVREQHGVVSALNYLIGEKLMTYAETAVRRPEFARELPRFVAEIRSIFSVEEIRLYLEHLVRMDAQEEEAFSAEVADDDMTIETPEQRAARTARLARLKERPVGRPSWLRGRLQRSPFHISTALPLVSHTQA